MTSRNADEQRLMRYATGRDRMHSRCRLNNKFTGVLCACGCHNEVT